MISRREASRPTDCRPDPEGISVAAAGDGALPVRKASDIGGPRRFIGEPHGFLAVKFYTQN